MWSIFDITDLWSDINLSKCYEYFLIFNNLFTFKIEFDNIVKES